MIYPGSEMYGLTFRHTASSVSIGGVKPPIKMEQIRADVSKHIFIVCLFTATTKMEMTEFSEMSAHKIQTPDESPERKNTTF